MTEYVDTANQRLDPTPGTETPTERIAEIATAIATELQEPLQKRLRHAQRLAYILFILLAASLLLHSLTLARLFEVRSTIRSELENLATGIESAKQQQLTYEVAIDQNVPIDVVIPIDETFVIPVDTNVRIQEEFIIPIDTGFGELNLPVPLDVNIPISTEVPITFQQNVDLSTSVDLQLTVPIEIDLGTPQFEEYLDGIKETLLEFRDQL